MTECIHSGKETIEGHLECGMCEAKVKKLTAKDVEDAVAMLLRHAKRPDYYVFLAGVRLMLVDQYCTISVIDPCEHIAFELQGTEALNWIADACREKQRREHDARK